MNFFCIADEDTVWGFRLAGIAGRAVSTVPEASAALTEASRRPDCGIIVLTQKVAAGIRAQVDAIRLERDLPLVLEIPGPEGPLPGHKSLRQLVQEAVGLRIDREEAG